MENEFFKLFKGLSRAYGTYTLEDISTAPGEKAGGRALTVQEEVTSALWLEHITGKQGLGIVPITDDALSYFGAIDIDVYDLDFDKLEHDIKENGLPLTICATKSMGAHLYAFIPQGQASSDVRSILAQYAAVLGYPGIEIFPKQDALAGEGDVGNWINMPYFGNTRKAYVDGRFIEAEEFLAHVKLKYVDALIPPSIDDDLVEAPPCLQVLASRGVPAGQRNDALFNFGVLAKMQDEDTFGVLVNKYNEAYMDPPLSRSEVHAVIKSVSRKDYFYKCKQPLLKAICDKISCRKREYGIGKGSGGGIAIEALDKICSVPPTWIVQVSGKRMRLSTDELVSQLKFATKCLETVNYLPVMVKADVWTDAINKMMAEVREIEAPVDAGPEGQFLYHLEQFCTTRAPANSVDELLLGKPWHDEGRTYFRAADLLKYLDQQHFREYKGNQIYAVLRHHIEGIEHHEKNLKGSFVNCWSIPEFNKQTEDFDVPRTEEEEF